MIRYKKVLVNPGCLAFQFLKRNKYIFPGSWKLLAPYYKGYAFGKGMLL